MRRGLDAITAQKFQYGDFRDRLDPQAVLDYYNAENAHEQANAHDGTIEVIHSCLLDRVIPHHANGDQNPSAAANLDKKLYVCYSYVDPETGKSGMDFFRLIMLLEGKSDPSDVIPLLSQFLGASRRETDTLRDEITRAMLDLGDPRTAVIPTYSERILRSWACTHPYVIERGIDLDTASLLQIGYDEDENRITIPHFWNGVLSGWQKRAIPECPGQWPGTCPPHPKYRSSPGFPKSNTLYRFDEARQSTSGTVVVVESPFSVIKARAILPDFLKTPVVATFGAKVSDRQIALLKEFRTVVVWADDDDAGRGMERRLVRNLPTRAQVVVPDAGKDMGDYDTPEEILEKIESAVPGVVKMMEYQGGARTWAINGLASAR